MLNLVQIFCYTSVLPNQGTGKSKWGEISEHWKFLKKGNEK